LLDERDAHDRLELHLDHRERRGLAVLAAERAREDLRLLLVDRLARDRRREREVLLAERALPRVAPDLEDELALPLLLLEEHDEAALRLGDRDDVVDDRDEEVVEDERRADRA